MIPAPFEHQSTTVEFCHRTPRVLNFSDPGTGKTRAHIDAFAARPGRKRALVLAPSTLLQAAWGNDIATFQPSLSYAIADAKNRKAAFYTSADIVLCNHDGVKAVKKLLETDRYLLDDFDELIIDEATAYKNLSGRGGAARSQAVADLRARFPHRRLLTGTPGSNSILDVWALAFLCDDGQRLGTSFYKFRNEVTVPVQVGPSSQMIQWRERPGAVDTVTHLLDDITVRFKKEDCLDIPPNQTITVRTTLPTKIRQMYNEMVRESAVMLDNGSIVSAVHAGARAQKLLQLCTGAVYDRDGDAQITHLERYGTVIDLICERPWPCVVVFNWQHEREQLAAHAEARGLRYAVLDGNVPMHLRANIVDQFQSGLLNALFIHPVTAAHGITLTAGRTTIWSSPTVNAEHFLQANARIHRAGQTERTETILIAALGTREEHVYELLQGKVDRVQTILDIFVSRRTATA